MSIEWARPLATDDEFLERVLTGSEPHDHAGNVRLAWTMRRRYGYAEGLERTEDAIRRRAERTGGRWDRELTLRWYDSIAAQAAEGPDDFAAFVIEHGLGLERSSP